jgi:zinc protease
VNPAEVREKVQKYFGDIGPGPVIKRQQEWVPKLQGTHRATLQDRVPQARIYKVWNVPGYKQRDYTLLQLAANVLAGGKNSRLYKRLVYTDQTTTSVNAFVGPFELASQVQIVATVKPGGDAAVLREDGAHEVGAVALAAAVQEDDVVGQGGISGLGAVEDLANGGQCLVVRQVAAAAHDAALEEERVLIGR